MKQYDHKDIEQKWQKKWQEEGIYVSEEDSSKPKSYVLDMFPYPSGEGLHVGHPKGYIATDIYSRFKKMNGFNILHPMGWDAFGLPAENYALKNKVHPRVAVEKNIARYKEQLSILGLNYDWSREINTTDPKYYKWTQWIFLKLFEEGLAYESFEPINWCPSCKTGLANEDLDGDKCERCGTKVEKKPLRQWVLKITDYADRLLKDIDPLDWPESIKELQRNWIGRSEGAEISFEMKVGDTTKNVTVFTTRPDTLFGVTYIVLAPENRLVQELKDSIENWSEVEKYVEEVKNKSDIERNDKTGVRLKGLFVINPATNEEVPVWIADYVLASYGTGAVMAVPAHDERDYEFAKKYHLPIKLVLEPITGVVQTNPEKRKSVVAVVKDPKTGKFLSINWGKAAGGNLFIGGGREEGEDVVETAIREIAEETGYTNVKYISQTEIIHHNYFAVSKNVAREIDAVGLYFELIDQKKNEAKLDEAEKGKFTVEWITEKDIEKTVVDELHLYAYNKLVLGKIFTGEGILFDSGKFTGFTSTHAKKEITESVNGKWVTKYKLRDWVFARQRYWGEPIPLIHCEKCGVVPVPEKDLPVVLPEVEFYEPSGTGESPLANMTDWVNVSCPKCNGKGKRETNTMPQWAGSSWYYLRYMDPHNDDALVDSKNEKYWAPVDFYVGGAEHATRHLIYARFWHKFLFDIGAVSTEEPFKKLQHVGLIAGPDGRKMSKRYSNVVNPDDVVAQYGADTLRVYEMFLGPFDQGATWSMESIIGPRRFLERVWKLKEKITDGAQITPDVESSLHKTIKKVGEDINGFKFNTAISTLMILVNELEKSENIANRAYLTLLQLLAPFAPHMTEELWREMGNASSIHISDWPQFDEKKLAKSNVKIIVQVNGKVRSTFEAEMGVSEDDALKTALSMDEISKWVGDNAPKKVVFVPDKLINIVV